MVTVVVFVTAVLHLASDRQAQNDERWYDNCDPIHCDASHVILAENWNQHTHYYSPYSLLLVTPQTLRLLVTRQNTQITRYVAKHLLYSLPNKTLRLLVTPQTLTLLVTWQNTQITRYVTKHLGYSLPSFTLPMRAICLIERIQTIL